MESFIVFKYNANYFTQNNVQVKGTYIQLHKIRTNDFIA